MKGNMILAYLYMVVDQDMKGNCYDWRVKKITIQMMKSKYTAAR